MPDTILSIVIGILSSLAASLVWLIAFSYIRPKIEISTKIVKTVNWAGKTVYKIKVINRSKRAIMNIQTKLLLLTPKVVPNGFITTTDNVEIRPHELFALSKFDKNDKEALYAQRFTIYENLDEIWEDDRISYLRFSIYATDSLSGLGKVHQQIFRLKRNSIVNGDFDVGDTFEIL